MKHPRETHQKPAASAEGGGGRTGSQLGAAPYTSARQPEVQIPPRASVKAQLPSLAEEHPLISSLPGSGV